MFGLTETWRGEALAWEADELGHMNMRYYFSRALQGRAAFAHKLGLPALYKQTSLSTLVPTRQHIKYLSEMRPGQGMAVRTGVLEIGEDVITLLHLVTGQDEKPSATIVETLTHMSVRGTRRFNWPHSVRSKAEKLQIDMPEIARPRNIALDEPTATTNMHEADKLDLPVIGRGMFMPSECDVFGNVLPTAIIGRVSDSVQHLKTGWPDLDFASDDGLSGALLEACARHKNRPKAGDLYVMRSGLRSANTHVRDICHWILDPVAGKCWSSFVGVGCRFNLRTRRLMKIDADTLSMLDKGIVKNLHP